MEKNKVLNSEIVFKGKIFNIKRDKVLLDNNKEAYRDILVHKGATCAVPITKDNKIVLVKQYRHATEDFLYEIPAGGLEDGENPKDCIIRELQEEIGYKPNSVEFLYQIYLAPGYSSEKIYCYLCKDLEKSSLPCDDDENIEVVEFTFEEIWNLIRNGKIQDAKTISCILTVMKLS